MTAEYVSPLMGIEADACLVIRKDTMAPFILAGDRLLVRYAKTAENGQVVTALVNGEMTVRRVAGDLFAADNPLVEPVVGAEITGVVVGVVRTLRCFRPVSAANSRRFDMADHLPGYGHGVEPLTVTIDGEQVAFVAAKDALIDGDTVFCLDCEGRAGPSCADYHGHGVATLRELMNAYSNPRVPF